jgi:hypothetical protein
MPRVKSLQLGMIGVGVDGTEIRSARLATIWRT